jgi:hypothetical protein
MPRRGIVDRRESVTVGWAAPFPSPAAKPASHVKNRGPCEPRFHLHRSTRPIRPSFTTGHSSWFFFFKKRGYVHKGLEAYFAVKDWITMDLEKNKKL